MAVCVVRDCAVLVTTRTLAYRRLVFHSVKLFLLMSGERELLCSVSRICEDGVIHHG